ncbi:hypothetical protein GXW82_42410 [Streptacidiphilus sp. 4-A2]|nr:hypothetical protein [Streptacidiphilus sp. 4-A2]
MPDHLRQQPQGRAADREHRLTGLQRAGVEAGRPGEAERMTRGGQRQPQPGRPERPQPAQGQRQSGALGAGDSLRPVGVVRAADRLGGVVR